MTVDIIALRRKRAGDQILLTGKRDDRLFYTTGWIHGDPNTFLEIVFLSNAAIWKRSNIDEKKLWPKKSCKFYVERWRTGSFSRNIEDEFFTFFGL